MKKKRIYLLILLILSVYCVKVEAKTVEKTCDYEADTCPADGVVAVCHNKVKVYIYSDNTAKAEILISKGVKKKDLVKESIPNWSTKKEEYKKNNRCFSYILLTYKGANKVYVSDSKEELEELVRTKKWKLNDNAFIISGIGSRKATEKDWQFVKEVTSKLKNIETDERYTCYSLNKSCSCYDEYESIKKEIEADYNEILNLGSAIGATFGKDARVQEYNKLYQEVNEKLVKLREKIANSCQNIPGDEEDDPSDLPPNKDFDYNSSSKTCISCGNGAFTDIPMQLPTFIRNMIFMIQLLIPIILIGLGMYDFIRAIVASDEKLMKESQNRFIRRIIASVIIFFVIAIVKLIFGLIPGDVNTLGCVPCFISDEDSCGEPYICSYAVEDIGKE